MKPCIRRSEHALSVRRWVWPSCRPTSMHASSACLMAWEGGGRYQNFDLGVRGRMGRGSSEWGEASFLGAVCAYEILPAPSESTFCGRWGFISGRDTPTYHDRTHRVSEPATFCVLGVRFTSAPKKHS
jgi:hypothetical protein